ALCIYTVRLIVFFFSSRRRHTRFKCDWSSDVCSSDLHGSTAVHRKMRYTPFYGEPPLTREQIQKAISDASHPTFGETKNDFPEQIGRASGRERSEVEGWTG